MENIVMATPSVTYQTHGTEIIDRFHDGTNACAALALLVKRGMCSNLDLYVEYDPVNYDDGRHWVLVRRLDA